MQTFEEQLDSDDELPTDYTEEREIPAYLNEHRFDAVQFKWIDNNFSKYYAHTQHKKSGKYRIVDEDMLYKKDTSKSSKPGKNILLSIGVLSKQDIFCLKSIESLTGDSTLIWLVNFLIFKDLQADYTFLKTCLVNPMLKKCIKNTDIQYSESKQFHFEFITNSDKKNAA